MRPTLNCTPFPLAVGTFSVTKSCGTSPCVPRSNPPDLITAAFWPNSSSAWKPALHFAAS